MQLFSKRSFRSGEVNALPIPGIDLMLKNEVAGSRMSGTSKIPQARNSDEAARKFAW